MIRNKFDIALGNRLRNAEMAVPEDAWAAIQSRINSAPKGPIKNSPPFSNTGFIAGISVGAVMLVSLSVYTHFDIPASDQISENYLHVQPKVIVVQHDDITVEDAVDLFENDDLIEVKLENTTNKAAVDVEEKLENRNARTAVSIKPIPATNVKEIQSKRKKELVQRSLPSKKQVVSSSVRMPAVAKISADKTSGAAPLSVQFKNRGQGDVHYWRFGSKTDSYETSPTVLFEDPGTYTITLMVENKDGEIDEDVMVIKVVEGSKIFIPNSFTPNGDGHNDTYKVASAQNIEEFHMVVTNQLGKVVYESRDINGAWEFDKAEHGNAGDMFFLTYMAVGSDGKIHSEKLRPIYIFY